MNQQQFVTTVLAIRDSMQRAETTEGEWKFWCLLNSFCEAYPDLDVEDSDYE